MYEDDFLVRQIRRVVEVLARLARGEQVPAEDVDQAASAASGLDLATVDALPAGALAAMVVRTDPRNVGRMRALADLLDAIAGVDALGDARRVKAAAIRAACVP